MKRVVNVSISLAFVALALAISASAAKPRAALTITATDAGVSVTGRNFLPRERVVLRATFDGGTLKRAVRADARGRFTSSLGEADTSCSDVYVTAAGARGSTASTRRVKIPEACGIVIQP
jgi:hypothetical protein